MKGIKTMKLNSKKKNTAGGGLYIALAICILSVICIGVYSAIISIFNSSLSPIAVKEGEEKSKTPSIIIETPNKDGDQKAPAPSVTVPSQNENKEALPEKNANANPTPPGYTMPVAGDVMKEFSQDILVYSTTMNDYRVHNGVDLAAAVGTPVKAFTDGVVLEIYEDPLMGHTVVIDHGENLKSFYQNLSEAVPDGIVVGATVREGDVIGGVGDSNLIECAEEPHLHFEVQAEGKAIDPMQYFENR